MHIWEWSTFHSGALCNALVTIQDHSGNITWWKLTVSKRPKLPWRWQKKVYWNNRGLFLATGWQGRSPQGRSLHVSGRRLTCRGHLLWPNSGTSLLRFYGYFRELVAPFALQQSTVLIWRCNELPKQASLQILLLCLCACKKKLHQNVSLGPEKIPGWETRRTFHHSWCLKRNHQWRCLNLKTHLLMMDMFSRKIQDFRFAVLDCFTPNHPSNNLCRRHASGSARARLWLTDYNFTHVRDKCFCFKAHELTDFLLSM